MSDILEKIFAAKALHVERDRAAEPYERMRERALARAGERRGFANSLRGARGAAIIAEIKRASPSAGLIARNFDPAAIASRYDAAHVDAVSVLTEEDHFLGQLAYLDVVRAATSRPLLRKDFLSTPFEIAQSAAYGADAVLLIVAGLTDEQLHACFEEAALYALDVLVEVHDARELERAAALGATLIGVNNRNLHTFETDLATSEYLVPLVPAGAIAVTESGMRTPADIVRLHRAGARAFLIGESLMRLDDPTALIATLKHALAEAAP